MSTSVSSATNDKVKAVLICCSGRSLDPDHCKDCPMDWQGILNKFSRRYTSTQACNNYEQIRVRQSMMRENDWWKLGLNKSWTRVEHQLNRTRVECVKSNTEGLSSPLATSKCKTWPPIVRLKQNLVWKNFPLENSIHIIRQWFLLSSTCWSKSIKVRVNRKYDSTSPYVKTSKIIDDSKKMTI